MFRPFALFTTVAVFCLLGASANAQIDWSAPSSDTVWYLYMPGCIHFDYSGAASTASVVIHSTGHSTDVDRSCPLTGISELEYAPVGVVPGMVYLEVTTDMGEIFTSPVFEIRTVELGNTWVPTACDSMPFNA